MSHLPILGGVTEWECRSCGATDTTTQAGPHVRFHACPALGGLTAPMLRLGTKARVTTREIEDYAGDHHWQTDAAGRPVMATVTEHADGRTDVIVYAPAAKAEMNN